MFNVKAKGKQNRGFLFEVDTYWNTREKAQAYVDQLIASIDGDREQAETEWTVEAGKTSFVARCEGRVVKGTIIQA